MSNVLPEEINRFRMIFNKLNFLSKRDQSTTIDKMEDGNSDIISLAENSKPRKTPSGQLLFVSIIGVRGHGKKHVNNFLAIPECHIAYICDIDLDVGNDTADYIYKVAGYRPKVVQDFRASLDDPHVDIVTIATPHHWHAPAAIWALQAGKHVYLEKPISHTFAEGQAILDAAKKYGKCVQAGLQLRSNTSLQAAADFISKGGIGNCTLAQCITYKPRPAMVPYKSPVIPEKANFDIWCGPAPANTLKRTNLHYDWHWFWEFGNGALGNNGVHRIDAARIGLGLRGFGTMALSYGGRFGPADSGETPNVQSVVHRFGKTWIFHDIVGLPKRAYRNVKNGIIFYGSDNNIIYQNGVATLTDQEGKLLTVFPGKQENHYRNFIDAIIENKPEILSGDLYDAHVSSGLCHLGNISYRLAKPTADKTILSKLQELNCPKEIEIQLGRLRNNLTSNKVENAKFRLGRALAIDPKTGDIQGDPEASILMSKDYRPGFELERA